MLENIKNYVEDREFRFTVYPDKVDVINFSSIISLEEEKVLLTGGLKKITIHGKKLSLNKLLEEEILIIGEITSIEVSNE